ARAEIGPWASFITSFAILFIVIIALAGLGLVVVKALGGEEVKLPKTQITVPQGQSPRIEEVPTERPAEEWSHTLWGQVRHYLGLDKPTVDQRVLQQLRSAFAVPDGVRYVIAFPPNCSLRYSPKS